MQSHLQYRRFGRHVRAKHERDRGKANDRRAERTSQFRRLTSPNSTTTAAEESNEKDDRDIEKGEQAPAPVDGEGEGEAEGVSVSAEYAFESHRSMQPATITNTQSNASKIAIDGSMGTNLGTALTGINVHKRTPKESPDRDDTRDNKVFVVGYEGKQDISNPHYWSYATIIRATVNIAFIGWIVGFSSSVDSAALVQASKDFSVSEVIENLAAGLFLVGVGTGAPFRGTRFRDTLYLSVIYIILSTFLDGYTFIYTETYGFSEGITGLSFIGVGVSLYLASLLVLFIYKFTTHDLAKIKAEGRTWLPPEFRLYFAMVDTPAIPMSLF
ncbi:MAG: hypothetical protein Q9166_002362 [cf. Caloplaca sp. 2 TL-2023]